ncbi:MAG: ABC transporter permease [Bdellovibrionales bacterium]
MKTSTVDMSRMKWVPFLSLLKKEIKRFLRVARQTLLIPLVNSGLYLFIFGVSLGDKIAMEGVPHYLAFLIPGILMMGCMNNAFQNSSSSIGSSKFHGDLEDLRVVPLSASQIALAMSLGGLVRGVAVAILIFLMGDVFYWFSVGEFLTIQHPFLLTYFLVTGGLVFSCLGIAIGFWAKNFDQMTAVGGFILLPLLYLGGVFFSIDQLHPIWQWISQLNPMLYFINGVRYGIVGHTDVEMEIAGLFTFITTILLYWLAVRSIRNGMYGRW